MNKINLRYRLGVIAAAFAVLMLSIALTETSASANDLASHLGKSRFIQLDAAGAPHLIAAPTAAMQSVIEVKALVANGNDIYVGGAFESIGGIAARGIARYNVVSQRWFALGADLQTNGNGVRGFVSTITVVGNDVYVAGSFSGGDNRLSQFVSANCVARWNIASSTWFALGSGTGPQKNGFNGDVTSSVSASGKVYFAGYFKNAYNSASSALEVNNVACWNPTTSTWSSLGKGIGADPYEAYDLAVVGDNLYMGGRFPWVIRADNYKLHVDCIARWNLTSNNWFPLGVDSGHSGTNGCGGDVHALATDGAMLYVGGTFREAHNSGTDQPPASHIARWNGTSWSTLNGNNNVANNGLDSNVTELCFNSGMLYVGGDFANVQNTNGVKIPANHLARWDGSAWSLFGAAATVNGNGVDDEVNAMLMVGGQLYVGGLFTEAYNNTGNAVSASGLARWTGTIWTTVSGAAIKALSAVSAASYFANGEAASEGIMAAFGTGLATGVQAGNTVPLPTNLLNTTLSVRDAAGTGRPAQLFFVSGAQVNFLVPIGTTPGTATVTITSGDGSQSQGAVNVVAYAPGLFGLNADGQGVVAAVAYRLKANGQATYENIARYDAPTSRWVATPIDLGPAGEKVFLIAFGTSFRGRGSAPATMTIGGADAPVGYAGSQGALIGVDQVNAEIARSLIGRGEVNVVFTVGSKTANTVKINVK